MTLVKSPYEELLASNQRWLNRAKKAQGEVKELAEYLRTLRDQAADMQASINRTLKLMGLDQ